MITCSKCKLPLDIGNKESMSCPRCNTLITRSSTGKSPVSSFTGGRSVVCSVCNTVNTPGAAFCGDCGKDLKGLASFSSPSKPSPSIRGEIALCPSCGAANVKIARFCGDCGHTMTVSPGSGSSLQKNLSKKAQLYQPSPKFTAPVSQHTFPQSQPKYTVPIGPGGLPPGVAGNMFLIPGGLYRLSSYCEVQLSSFYIGKYPVTGREYCEFLNDSGCKSEEGVEWIDRVNLHRYINGGPGPGSFSVGGSENLPAVYITWYGAVAYCNWLSEKEGLTKCYGPKGSRGQPSFWSGQNGYRLPTEAEWEVACRGNTTTKYYWGETMNENYCWHSGNSGGKLHEAGKKGPNSFGLYDMLGNVWEFCSDWFGSTKSGTLNNPTGPPIGSNRIIKGGSYMTQPDGCQSSNRLSVDPVTRERDRGFRVVRNA